MKSGKIKTAFLVLVATVLIAGCATSNSPDMLRTQTADYLHIDQANASIVISDIDANNYDPKWHSTTTSWKAEVDGTLYECQRITMRPRGAQGSFVKCLKVNTEN